MPKLLDLKFPGECKSLPEGFWSAVDVWIKKPHVVNKRLCGVKETESEHVGAEALQLLLGDPELSNTVLCLLTRGAAPAQHDHDKPWSSSVRTIIPKVNCYGTNVHKELVLKGKSSHESKLQPNSDTAFEISCFFCLFKILTDNKWPLYHLKRLLKGRFVSREATFIRFSSSIRTVRNGEWLNTPLKHLWLPNQHKNKLELTPSAGPWSCMCWLQICGSPMASCTRSSPGSPLICCPNSCAGPPSAGAASSGAPCLCCQWTSTASCISSWRRSTRPWSR